FVGRRDDPKGCRDLDCALLGWIETVCLLMLDFPVTEDLDLDRVDILRWLHVGGDLDDELAWRKAGEPRSEHTGREQREGAEARRARSQRMGDPAPHRRPPRESSKVLGGMLPLTAGSVWKRKAAPRAAPPASRTPEATQIQAGGPE